jgi:hypothetical protein
MAGGMLIGERPLRSQGVVSAEDARRFASIAEALWSSCEQSADHRAAIGKGQLYCTDSAHSALKAAGALQDFETAAGDARAFDYVHRRAGGMDIYFIRNTQPKPVEAAVTLRVEGKQPELFDAVTGKISQTLLFSNTADHRTRVALALEPYGSVFVVFRHPAAKNPVARIARDGAVLYSAADPDQLALPQGLSAEMKHGSDELETPLAGEYEIAFEDGVVRHVHAAQRSDADLSGPWTLSFPPNWGAPAKIELNRLESWTQSSDPGVRYFSGTATYRTTLRLDAGQLAASDDWMLGLGEVHELAAVRINGKPAQILWKSPFTVRVDSLLHAGENSIEIDVTNFWPNRLIGDAQSPQGKHYTWTNIREYTKDSPLMPSGLLGPVELSPVYALPLGPAR